ncbi:MAG: hypothetical protein APF76_03510 [Desulfitibacter sp. BRH_c19]|nr:MAG: hypothetical protein APF76_03510 [Desulfitibacter sp. BRH_c19]
MNKGKDVFILWVIAGITGVIARDIYSVFAKMIGFADFYIWSVGAALMIEQKQIQTISGTIVGLLIDIVVGAMFGVIIGLLIERRGKSGYIIKGWGVGLAAWMFFYGILYHNLPFTTGSAPSDPLSNLSAFIGHSIFGIVGAVVYVNILGKKFAETYNINSYSDSDNNVSECKKKPMRFKVSVQPVAKKIIIKKPSKLMSFKKSKKSMIKQVLEKLK